MGRPRGLLSGSLFSGLVLSAPCTQARSRPLTRAFTICGRNQRTLQTGSDRPNTGGGICQARSQAPRAAKVARRPSWKAHRLSASTSERAPRRGPKSARRRSVKRGMASLSNESKWPSRRREHLSGLAASEARSWSLPKIVAASVAVERRGTALQPRSGSLICCARMNLAHCEGHEPCNAQCPRSP
jgi:hypothetical protein